MVSGTKCGFVAVVGEPNSGKSTLINRIVGEKVSIVSPKCQTTRRQVRGIVQYEDWNTQLVFIDTPGFFKAKTSLERAILSNFRHAYKDADIVLVMIDSTKARSLEYTQALLEKIGKREAQRVSIIINKVDIVKKESILKIASELSKYEFVDNIFMISALDGTGIDKVEEYLKQVAPEGPHMYGTDQKTDMNMGFRLAEVTREKIYKLLSAELPYNIYVETEMFKESEKKAKVFQSIVVLKDSQKGIVLGHKGERIKNIKDLSIEDMKVLLKKKIELKLFVKVKEHWIESKEHLQNAGIIDF